MSLRSKIILILSVVVVGYAALDVAMLGFTVRRSFGSLERKEAEKDLGRVVAFLDAEREALARWCRSWATLRSTAEFLEGRDPSFAEQNLGPGVLRDNGLDLLILCDETGRTAWRRIEDPESREETSIAEFPAEALGRVMNELRASRNGGLMDTAAGLLLVSFCEVTGGEEGAPVGTLVAGRFVGDDLIARVAGQTGVTFRMWRSDARDLPARVAELADEITGGERAVVEIGEDERLHAYSTIPTISRTTPVLVRAEVPREIMEHGRSAVNYALLSAPATALVILLALLHLLDRIVIRPLTRVTAHAVEVGRTDDTTSRIGSEREDEIGVLANEFDRMLSKLAASREQTVTTARLAGMSEIATGVLHNVGNVLNSVNVSANVAAKRVEKLPTQDLVMMSKVLAEQGDVARFVSDDPRGKHLVPFLAQLSHTLEREQRELVQELRTLRGGIEHIAELVRSQQTYAGTKGVFERASLAELMDTAVKICSQAYGVSDGIEIVREYEPMPSIPVDKHKLIEILVNLIQNARQALLDSTNEPKRIVLRLAMHGEDKARIQVADNGIGIPKENLTRVFKHGFTTKKRGHGFGLHVSANAATEMKSALHAESDGPGRGATFVLDIPVRIVTPAMAA